MNAIVFFLLLTAPVIKDSQPEVKLMPTQAECERAALVSARRAWCVPLIQLKP